MSSQEEIDALIKANDAESSRLLGEALMTESSNELLEFSTNTEMAALEQEIAALQKDYDDSIKDIQNITDSQVAADEQITNQELDGLMNQAQHSDMEYNTAMKNYEQELAAYEAELAAWEAKQKEKTELLKDANELMILGLIPSDYNGNDDALLASIKKIKGEKQVLEDFASKGDVQKKVIIKKYNAYLDAYRKFSIKYRRDIEEYNYQYEETGVDVRKVGEFYMPFGLRHILDASDPARMGGIVRPYWKLDRTSNKEKGIVPMIAFTWNGTEWTQDFENWVQARKKGNDREIFFLKNGHWGNTFLPGEKKRYDYAPFLEKFDSLLSEEFIHYIPNNYALPRNYKVKDEKIAFRDRNAFERCPPGYWFRRGVPEESSQCVYMGDNMADYKESFYTRYVKPSFQPTPMDEAEYLVISYDAQGNRIVPDTTIRRKEGAGVTGGLVGGGTTGIDPKTMILFRREDYTLAMQQQKEAGLSDVQIAASMGYKEVDVIKAYKTQTYLVPKQKTEQQLQMESIREAEMYKKNENDSVVITPSGGVTTQGVIAQNTAAGGRVG